MLLTTARHQPIRSSPMRRVFLFIFLSFSFPKCSSWMIRSAMQRVNGALLLRKVVPPFNKSWTPPQTRLFNHRQQQKIGSVHSSRLYPAQSTASPELLTVASNTTTIDVNDLTTAHLLQTIRELEDENARLQHTLANRIVLETFEGEQNTFPTNSAADDASLWCDQLDDNETCPIEPAVSFGTALKDRSAWLVGLLLLQSASGLILAHNEALLANHPVIIYYLTMLVGAGGNAGNQASVRVIRGLALGSLNEKTQSQFLLREVKMAGALSCILSLAGFLRTILFRTPLPEAIAVTSALSLIVFSSVCFGAILPLVLQRLRVDPAHSSTTIQVIMDILGVVLAVAVSSFVLDSPFGHFLIAQLTTT